MEKIKWDRQRRSEHMQCINRMGLNNKNRPTAIERFWAGIRKDEHGCWIWTKNLSKGYGAFKIDGRRSAVKVHRWAYEYFKNEKIPSSSVLVCHTCDVKACVNPDHLFLGDTKINAEDAISKGRYCRGSNHVHAKLIEKDIIEIRRLHKTGLSYTEIGKRYNVSGNTISLACRKSTWTHVGSRKRIK